MNIGCLYFKKPFDGHGYTYMINSLYFIPCPLNNRVAMAAVNVILNISTFKLMREKHI